MALTATNIIYAALVGSAVGLSAFFMVGGPPKTTDSVQNDDDFDANSVSTVSHTYQDRLQSVDSTETPIPIQRKSRSLIEQYQKPLGMVNQGTHQSFQEAYEDSAEYPRHSPPAVPDVIAGIPRGEKGFSIGGKSKRRSRKHKRRRRRTSSSSKHR